MRALRLVLSLTAWIAVLAVLILAGLVAYDPDPAQPWMEPFYIGVCVGALLFAPVAVLKGVRLEEGQEPIEDPASFDPEEPEEDMIEPDPGPTLGALLARKRSLNLARAR